MSRDIVSTRPVCWISTTGASPATVTLSSRPPTIMSALTVAVKSDGKRISSRTNTLNPEVFHPVLNPWMRELVRSYFLEQRQAAPMAKPQARPGAAPPTEAGSSLPPVETAEKDA